MNDRPAIYIEMIPLGNAVEIAAIHSETGREVRFVVPAGTSEHDIKQLAHAKLIYVERKASEQAEEARQKPKDKGGRGIVV